MSASAVAGFGAANDALRARDWVDAGYLGATRGGTAGATALLAAGIVHRIAVRRLRNPRPARRRS